MEIIFDLIIWFLIEVIFWGILFWTGYTVLLIMSLGKWKIQSINGDRKKFRKEPKFIATAVIGFLFWLGVGIALIIVLQ